MNNIIAICLLISSLAAAEEKPQRPNSKFFAHFYEIYQNPNATSTNSKSGSESPVETTTTLEPEKTTKLVIPEPSSSTKSSFVEGMMYNTCLSGSSCQEHECCAMGHTRYSLPQCLLRGGLGDFCLENSEPSNRTVSFPNGESVKLSEIYTLMCPCREDLVCFEGMCQDPGELNDVDDNNEEDGVINTYVKTY